MQSLSNQILFFLHQCLIAWYSISSPSFGGKFSDILTCPTTNTFTIPFWNTINLLIARYSLCNSTSNSKFYFLFSLFFNQRLYFWKSSLSSEVLSWTDALYNKGNLITFRPSDIFVNIIIAYVFPDHYSARNEKLEKYDLNLPILSKVLFVLISIL